MFKLLVSVLIFLSVTVWAEESSAQSQEVLLQAQTISGDSEYLHASGHVVLEYAKTVFVADHAKYDKIRKLLVISGNVHIKNPDGSSVVTQKLTLEVDNDKVTFKKFFYSDDDKIWLSSKTAQKKDGCYELKGAIFSSCTVDNPDWKMGFSEAKYNAKTKYIKLKDIKFYIGDTPVLYLPYLGFSTSKERSSGLLMPKLGYSSTDGAIYEQPIFVDIASDMDIELNPQVRTNRSVGLYSTLRFVDSNYSNGFLRLGYFRDLDEYFVDHNLQNQEHYGVEGRYESSDVLGGSKPSGYSDALYINLVLFNDIDYLNLQKSSHEYLSDSHLKESRINYALYDDEHYFGLNIRYFLDANKDSNQETLQELPSLQWHQFDKETSIENLTYSIDLNLRHYARKIGTQSRQLEMSIPIEYHLSFLDDYLKLDLSEEIFAFAGDFDIDPVGSDKYNAASFIHKAKLYSDIIKPYESGTHTLQLAMEYAKQTHAGDGVAEYDALDANLRRDFLSRKPFDDRLTMAMGQYWYGYDLALSAKQRISQTYYPDRVQKWGDLRHELEFGYKKWRMLNSFEYSFEYDGLSEVSNKIEYIDDKMLLHIEHFWRKDLIADMILTNEIAFLAKYKQSDRVKLFGSMTYDLADHYSKKWSTGILYDKGCWNIELSYTHDTQPVLESGGSGSIENNTVMIKINLVPLGGTEIKR